jgi:hypothetical protein
MEEKTSNKKTIIILIILAILVGAIPGFYIGIKYANKEDKIEEKQTVIKGEKEEETEEEIEEETSINNNENEEDNNSEDCYTVQQECSKIVKLGNKSITVKREASANNIYKEDLLITRVLYNNKILLDEPDIVIDDTALVGNNFIIVDYHNLEIHVHTTTHKRLIYSISKDTDKTIITYNSWTAELYTTKQPITNTTITYYEDDATTDEEKYEKRIVNVIEKQLILKEDGSLEEKTIGKKQTNYTGAQS